MLTWSASNIGIHLNGTCELCRGDESIPLNITTAPVPEPATMALFGASLAAAARRWRRQAVADCSSGPR